MSQCAHSSKVSSYVSFVSCHTSITVPYTRRWSASVAVRTEIPSGQVGSRSSPARSISIR